MSYDYSYETLPSHVDEETAIILMLVVFGVLGVILLVALVFAILRALGLYTIAKRRGIAHAWLSWIPIGSAWILGSVSDQYQHLAQNKVRSMRKILLILTVIGTVCTTVTYAGSIAEGIAQATSGEGTILFATAMASNMLASVIGIATLVIHHICNYDLYRSCNPKNAVVFLVLGIIIPVTEPFFYLACRRKDLGMPQPERIVTEPFGPEL